MMMFETSDQPHNTRNTVLMAETAIPDRESQQEMLEREAEVRRQEQELLVSKEKVFTKWQEYLDKSELVEARETEVKILTD